MSNKSLDKLLKRHRIKVQPSRRPIQMSCIHSHCSECEGSFVRKDGTPCYHSIQCYCVECNLDIE